MIATLPWYNVNRTIQPGFLLPGNTNYPISPHLQSSGWDVCHIFICCDYIKDDNTAKAKGNIPTGRMNIVRAFSLPLGPAAAGIILISPETPVKVCPGKTSRVMAEGSLLCDA